MKKTIITVSIQLDVTDIVGDLDDDAAVNEAIQYAFDLTTQRIKSSLLCCKLEIMTNNDLELSMKNAAINSYDRDIKIMENAEKFTKYDVERG